MPDHMNGDHAPRPSEIAPGFIEADQFGDRVLIDAQGIYRVVAKTMHVEVDDDPYCGSLDEWHRAIAGALEALDRSDIQVRRTSRQ